MLELNFIHDNKAEIIDRLAIKNFDASNIIEEIIELDIKRKATQTELDKALAETNKLAKEIGILYKTGQREKAGRHIRVARRI